MPFTDIVESYPDATLNIALNTIALDKQALVFCNTKRGAESQAEKIAAKIKSPHHAAELLAISDEIEHAVQSPTKQCQRLASIVRKGIAFHHSGLTTKQRDIIESRFRDGTIKIICATPTLAMGMDLPAYRSIIRDLKRYTQGTSWGMSDIPVLEYEQMSGRAGRPGKEDKGEAICIAETESEKERIAAKYVYGDPEDIYSKLAVEPVLRTYVLSLLSSGYVHDTVSLYAFFDETFYAWQYEDLDGLHRILDRMLGLLVEWGFVHSASHHDSFVSASELQDDVLRATPLGVRVAQLYLDPYTAHHLLVSLDHGLKKDMRLTEFSLLHLLCTTLEMKPLLSVKQGEIMLLDQKLIEVEDALFVKSPTIYSYEYEEFLQTVKTAMFLVAWVSERGEDVLFEEYGVRPGELQVKRERADWLLYSLIELSKLMSWHELIVEFEKMRVRLEYGAQEALLPLLRLKGIGRVRARQLYQNNIRSLDAVRKAELSTLRSLLGERLASSLKEQLGETVVPVLSNKRKGQINLGDYGE